MIPAPLQLVEKMLVDFTAEILVIVKNKHGRLAGTRQPVREDVELVPMILFFGELFDLEAAPCVCDPTRVDRVSRSSHSYLVSRQNGQADLL